MNTSAPKSIVIVGGGASATLLLAQLSLQLNAHSANPINIYIVDNSQAFKVGIAYNIEHPSFVLNVTANRMGAFPDKPEDFYQWLIDYPALWRNLHADFKTIEFQSTDFVPRMIYGAYLRWVFDQALTLAHSKNISTHRVVAQVTKINAIKNTKRLQVIIDTQEALNADTVILATGNAHQNHQDLIDTHIFSSPYCKHFLQQDWSNTRDVIVLGSGLSMVDAIQYITQQGYQGKFHLLSRHGLIPLPHSSDHNAKEAPDFLSQNLTSAKKIIRSIRKKITNNTLNGIGWQASINALRPHTNRLWLSLTDPERKKLKRLLPWWNIVRHRIPVDAYNAIKNLQHLDRLTITKGDVKKAESDGEYFLLKLNNKTLFIKSEKMVVCSGYQYELMHFSNMLKEQLKPKDQLQKDLMNCNFNISNTHSIYALGPCLAGILFETTSIHDIRQQALYIAESIKVDLKIFALTDSMII